MTKRPKCDYDGGCTFVARHKMTVEIKGARFVVLRCDYHAEKLSKKKDVKVLERESIDGKE